MEWRWGQTWIGMAEAKDKDGYLYRIPPFNPLTGHRKFRPHYLIGGKWKTCTMVSLFGNAYSVPVGRKSHEVDQSEVSLYATKEVLKHYGISARCGTYTVNEWAKMHDERRWDYWMTPTGVREPCGTACWIEYSWSDLIEWFSSGWPGREQPSDSYWIKRAWSTQLNNVLIAIGVPADVRQEWRYLTETEAVQVAANALIKATTQKKRKHEAHQQQVIATLCL